MSFDFNDMFKNFGQIREQAEQIKQKLSRLQITGEAGAGLVRVTMTGDGKTSNIHIDPALLDPKEKDMLEELLLSAIEDAQKKTKEAVAYEMQNIAGGFPIPGLEKLFGL